MPVQGLGEQPETHLPFMHTSFEPGQAPEGFDELHWVVVQGGRWHMPPEGSLSGLLQIVPGKQSPLEVHFFCTQ